MDLEKYAGVLAIAADALTKVAAERDALQAECQESRTKLAYLEQHARAEKVAAEMHSKGINADRPLGDLVDDLMKQASEGRLPVIEEAVKMSAPNMSMLTASIDGDSSANHSGRSAFERFLEGG